MPPPTTLGRSFAGAVTIVGLYLAVTWLWWSGFYLIDTRAFPGAFFAGVYTTVAAAFYFGVISVVIAGLWLLYVFPPRRLPSWLAIVLGLVAILLPLLVGVRSSDRQNLVVQAGAQILFLSVVAVGSARLRRKSA